MDLIDRQALLKQIDIDSDGEPGYYGDTWKFIDTIKSMPSATDKNVGTKLGTNLAGVGTDCISRQAAIEVVQNRHMMLSKEKVLLINDLEKLPSVQPKRGKWTADNACSECGCQPWFWKDIHNYNFCPNCGADMREVTE